MKRVLQWPWWKPQQPLSNPASKQWPLYQDDSTGKAVVLSVIIAIKSLGTHVCCGLKLVCSGVVLSWARVQCEGVMVMIAVLVSLDVWRLGLFQWIQIYAELLPIFSTVYSNEHPTKRGWIPLYCNKTSDFSQGHPIMPSNHIFVDVLLSTKALVNFLKFYYFSNFTEGLATVLLTDSFKGLFLKFRNIFTRFLSPRVNLVDHDFVGVAYTRSLS